VGPVERGKRDKTGALASKYNEHRRKGERERFRGKGYVIPAGTKGMGKIGDSFRQGRELWGAAQLRTKAGTSVFQGIQPIVSPWGVAISKHQGER